MAERSDNQRMLVKLLVIALAMFGFGFALVPFYKQICDATGVRDLTRPDEVKNSQVDMGRDVAIEFDANVSGNLPWRFKPEQNRIVVHPGQLTTVVYDIENVADHTIVGQAVPSYGPAVAARYFNKLECFCFTRQTFQAHEKRRMPVVFVVDAALPKEVNTITLSYNFFEVAGTAQSEAQDKR
ncbi:MAG: cytochrome c oxidase assembly protein [Burkholderiales bacterium]|nr:cytochrome c oxidase assembly protein [Burkholderiales bacterium]